MQDEPGKDTGGGIRFYYKTNETKYYLLTGGSGYPLADYYFADFSGNNVARLVVPENVPKTLNMLPKTARVYNI